MRRSRPCLLGPRRSPPRACRGSWRADRLRGGRAGPTRSREGPRHDHLRRRPAPSAFRVAGRILQARRGEERVPRVDAVVDDADPDPGAPRTGRRGVRGGAHHRRAPIQRQRVADAGIDLGHEPEAGERRQTRRRQVDGEAVHEQPEAPRHLRLRNRPPQRGGRRCLGAGEAREVGARRGVGDAEAALRDDPRVRRAERRRERRLREPYDDANPASPVLGRDGDRARADARMLGIAPDGLESRGRSRDGCERGGHE